MVRFPPNTESLATPIPPATINAPVVDDVPAVALLAYITPDDSIAPTSNVLAITLPETLINPLTVRAFTVAAVANKLPAVLIYPPAITLPPIPTPPPTTNAPVDVLVLVVTALAHRSPAAVMATFITPPVGVSWPRIVKPVAKAIPRLEYTLLSRPVTAHIPAPSDRPVVLTCTIDWFSALLPSAKILANCVKCMLP